MTNFLDILAQLIQAPAPVSELAAPHDMALPSLMGHLRKLESCGLIRTQKTGRVRMCRIEPARLSEAETWLSGLRQDWEGRLNRLDTYLTETAPNTKDP